MFGVFEPVTGHAVAHLWRGAGIVLTTLSIENILNVQYGRPGTARTR